jgi:outer membrane protein assembly factor BamB
MKNTISLIFLLMASCSSVTNFLGDIEHGPKLKGERISLAKLDQSITPDKILEQVKVTVPTQEDNIIWPISNGSKYLFPSNIALPAKLSNYKEYKVAGTREMSKYLTATPIIADGKIFIMNGSGGLIAYDAASMKKLWSKNTAPLDEKEESVGGGMSYDQGTLYITAGHRDVIAINAENGKEIWRYSLNNIVRSAPIFYDNKLFVMSIDNKLYALSSSQGSLLWMHEGAFETIGTFGASSLAISNDIILLPHSSGQLHALDTGSGKELWSVNLSYNRSSLAGFSFTDIDVPPVIDEGKIYIAGNMGLLYSIDLQSGRMLWQREIKGIKSIWAAGNFLYLIDANKELLCIHNKDGMIKWVVPLQSYLETGHHLRIKANVTGPIMAGDSLLLVTSNGKLLSFSPYDGTLIEEKKVPLNIKLLPAIASGKIYLLSNNGVLAIWQ